MRLQASTLTFGAQRKVADLARHAALISVECDLCVTTVGPGHCFALPESRPLTDVGTPGRFEAAQEQFRGK